MWYCIRMTQPARYVFLDFDGVTHCYFRMEGEDRRGNILFDFVPEILAAIEGQPYPVKVVISSSWRESHTLDQLRGHLGDLGNYVVGATPVVGNGCQWGDRLAEVRAWIQENDPGAAWVALDDAVELYAREEDDLDTIAVVRCCDGFGEGETQGLVEAIANPGGWASRHPVPVKFR